MLKDVGIAGKLAILVLLPMLGLVYFAGSKVVDKAGTASGAARLQQDTRLAVQVSAFVHEAQTERGMTALFVGSKGAKSAAELKDQRALTDAPAGGRCKGSWRAAASRLRQARRRARAAGEAGRASQRRRRASAARRRGDGLLHAGQRRPARRRERGRGIEPRAGADPRRRGLRQLPARQGADRAGARRARQGLHGRDVPGRRRDRGVPERGGGPGHPAARPSSAWRRRPTCARPLPP